MAPAISFTFLPGISCTRYSTVNVCCMLYLSREHKAPRGMYSRLYYVYNTPRPFLSPHTAVIFLPGRFLEWPSFFPSLPHLFSNLQPTGVRLRSEEEEGRRGRKEGPRRGMRKEDRKKTVGHLSSLFLHPPFHLCWLTSSSASFLPPPAKFPSQASLHGKAPLLPLLFHHQGKKTGRKLKVTSSGFVGI